MVWVLRRGNAVPCKVRVPTLIVAFAFAVGASTVALPSATAANTPGPDVSAPPAPVRFVAAPVTISGDFIVGGTVVASVGSFGDVVPTSLVFNWYRSDRRIAGAHEAVYLVRPADAGNPIWAEVTASAEGFPSVTSASGPTPAIAPGTMTAGTASISGGVRVGVEVVAKPSGFGPLEPTRYAYQWLRNGKPIKGATSKKYLVSDKDVHKRLSVQVTASRRAFTDATVTSAKSKRVPKRPKWVDPRCMDGSVLCVDMNSKDRKVRWVVNGKVKMTFDARFGGSSTPTRKGVYSVFLKSKDHYSTLYNTSMPYAMFFSGGQAVHYSPDFAYRGYNGSSHGCVNIRDRSGIAKLFSKVKLGTKVVVYG
jgi:hypothetical protein